MTELGRLKARLDELSPTAVRFIARVVESVSNAPSPSLGEQTWLNGTPEWIEYFGLAISVHHGTTTEPLGSLAFENAFRSACEAVGWRVDEHGSATRRFVDVRVIVGTDAARKLSLKSTAARGLKEDEVHISKLTEAAWIQDVRSAKDRRDQTLKLFRDYRNAVDAILMLRAFRKPGEMPTRYQLVEIPAALFASLESLPDSSFAADGPILNCAYGDRPVAAQVLLDRSDAKITVKRIQLEVCTVHAEWHVASTPASR